MWNKDIIMISWNSSLFERKKDCRYIILDDEFYNDYKLLCLNYYRTNMYQGLKNKDLPNISLKSVNLNNFII